MPSVFVMMNKFVVVEVINKISTKRLGIGKKYENKHKIH
jgi:hypothetical protein